jgi:toxin FitB
LADLARGRGHSPGFADIAIAATAPRHDLTILSRNERHFAPMDVAVVDPFRKLLPIGARTISPHRLRHRRC